MKIKRPYKRFSQDFSGESLTDTSFGPACDVNTIVKHYSDTGIDPFIDRKKTARYEPATTLTYDEAMRQKAEADSYLASLTPSERSEHAKAFAEWQEPPENEIVDVDESQAPQDATEANSEARKVE